MRPSRNSSGRGASDEKLPNSTVAKPQFAPIPSLTIGDKRLSASHWRLLSAIAFHDRLSVARKNGQGCWASNATLSSEANVHYNNVSTLLSDLVTWCYVLIERGAMKKCRRTIRVIYGHHSPIENSSIHEPIPVHPSIPKKDSLTNQGDGECKYIPLKRSRIEAAVSNGTSGQINKRKETDEYTETLQVIENEQLMGAYIDAGTRRFLEAIVLDAQPGSSSCERAKCILSKLFPASRD